MEEDKRCVWCKYCLIEEDGSVWCKYGYPKPSILGVEVAERCPKELICDRYEELNYDF